MLSIGSLRLSVPAAFGSLRRRRWCTTSAPPTVMAEYTQQRTKCAYTLLCDYFPASEVLVVEFMAYRVALAPPPLDGRPWLYYYDAVPEAVADYWFSIDCDGTWYNYNIRGVYAYTRIK